MLRRIVWSVVGVVALAAMVSMGRMIGHYGLSGGRASSARNAATALKTITTAETDFRENDRDRNGAQDYWVGDVSRLRFMEVDGKPLELIERSVGVADAAPLKPVPEARDYCGYRFAMLKTDETGAPYDKGKGLNPEKFGVCCYPVQYISEPTFWGGENDVTMFTFIVNEANVIWRKDTRAVPPRSWPKDPLAEGWSKLD